MLKPCTRIKIVNQIRAIKSISVLGIGTLVGAACLLLTQLILARQLGPLDFGTFSSALATVTLFTPLAGFGVAQFWLKAFGQEGWGALRWLTASFRFVVLSTLFVLLILVIWSVFGPHDSLTRNILISLSLYVPSQVVVALVYSKLQMEERYIYLVFWQLIPHFLRLSIIAILSFLLTDWMNGQNIAFSFAFVAVLVATIGSAQLKGMTKGHFDLKCHAKQNLSVPTPEPDIKAIIFQIWPFGLASFSFLIYYQIDIVLLKYIKGSEAAGIYNVAFTVISAMFLFPQVIITFLLPKMHRWANHDRDRFYQVYRQCNILMLISGIFTMLIVWLLAPWGLSFLFGNKYNDAISLLNVLALTIPVIFVASNVGATLITQEYMRIKVKYMCLVAIFNILLNIALIPSVGAMGAAIVTLLSNVMLLIFYYITAQKLVFGSDFIKTRKIVK